jgi:cobalt-zinc-cadmium efflux system outer membrane protein
MKEYQQMLKVIAILAIAFALIGPAALLSQESQRLNLDELVAEALQNNPQLRSAGNQAAATRTKVDQVTSWDAPQIGVEFYQTPIQSFPNPLKNGMETDYFIQQMIPFPGKLSAMGKAAENNAGMIDQEHKALERRIIRDLKYAYFELFHVQREIQVNAENQELMKKFTEITRKQYEVGMGQQADILRAQTELSTLINQGVSLLKEKKVMESMINTTLSRPANAPLGYVPEVEYAPPQWTFEQLRPLALENRPELKGMNFNIDMNKAELSGSKREYYPDIMARVMYKNMANTTDDFWSAMVGINIPLAFWSSGKYTSKVEENELNVRKAEDDLASMRNMVSFEVQDALVKVQSNYNLVLLYKNTTILQAEQTLQATLSAYQTGKTEFLMVIDAYRMQLMAKLDFHMAVMSYMASQAQLEQAVGLNIAQISERVQ